MMVELCQGRGFSTFGGSILSGLQMGVKNDTFAQFFFGVSSCGEHRHASVVMCTAQTVVDSRAS